MPYTAVAYLAQVNHNVLIFCYYETQQASLSAGIESG